MDDPGSLQTVKRKGSPSPQRYRVVARGNTPGDIVDVVSAAHAAAIAHATADGVAPEGDQGSQNDPGYRVDNPDDSLVRREGSK